MYEELINLLRNCATQPAPCGTCCMISSQNCSDLLMEQAADAIEELFGRDTNVPRWIPVTERLPEEYTTILFVSTPNRMHIGYYDSEHKSFCDMTGFRYVCTHWTPLPEPPKEDA